MSTDYKYVLDSLLKALAKHPDFAEIGEMVAKNMPVSASHRVEEIIAQKETIREAASEENYLDGFYLLSGKAQIDELARRATEGDSPFIIGETKQAADSDDVYFLIPNAGNTSEQGDDPFNIPDSGDSNDDDFGIITYG